MQLTGIRSLSDFLIPQRLLLMASRGAYMQAAGDSGADRDMGADKGADSERAWPEPQTRAFLKAYIKVSTAGYICTLCSGPGQHAAA